MHHFLARVRSFRVWKKYIDFFNFAQHSIMVNLTRAEIPAYVSQHSNIRVFSFISTLFHRTDFFLLIVIRCSSFSLHFLTFSIPDTRPQQTRFFQRSNILELLNFFQIPTIHNELTCTYGLPQFFLFPTRVLSDTLVLRTQRAKRLFIYYSTNIFSIQYVIFFFSLRYISLMDAENKG